MLAYLIIGALAGLSAGLFGIGGGVIVVPGLQMLFEYSSLIPIDKQMQMAIGTSFAAIVLTTLSASYAHKKLGTINSQYVKQLLPYLLTGVILGAIIANYLSSHFLKIIFGFFLLVYAIYLLLNTNHPIIHRDLSNLSIITGSLLIGVLSAILGIGAGILLVPFLMRLKPDIRKALGTSVTCTVFISLTATLCYLLPSFFHKETIPWSTGYIYWPAFLGIVTASILFAPIGAKLAHRLPTPILKRIFALFLLLIAVDMLLFL